VLRSRLCASDLFTDPLTQSLSSEVSIVLDQGCQTSQTASGGGKDGLKVMKEVGQVNR
jgi:hypothetical protein